MEREREGETETEVEKRANRKCVCECLCVCVRMSTKSAYPPPYSADTGAGSSVRGHAQCVISPDELPIGLGFEFGP